MTKGYEPWREPCFGDRSPRSKACSVDVGSGRVIRGGAGLGSALPVRRPRMMQADRPMHTILLRQDRRAQQMPGSDGAFTNG